MSTKLFLLGILATVGVVICGLLIIIPFYIASVNNSMVAHESALSTMFSANQTDLDNRITGVKELVDIAEYGGEQCAEVATEIIRAGIEGRFGDDGMDTEGAAFLAIAEDYPETASCNVVGLWNEVQTYVRTSRAEYGSAVANLQDRIRTYNTWRNSFPQKMVLGLFYNPPTVNLYAKIGTNTVYGQNALDLMSIVVTGTQTQRSLESGTYDGIDLDDR